MEENDRIFKVWRREVGTDRETTRRIIESEIIPVNYEYEVKNGLLCLITERYKMAT
jgi:hypothetical protein